MTSDLTNNDYDKSRDKPFPWRCLNCLKMEVRPQTIRHTAEVKYEGRLHRIEALRLTIPQCRACGSLVFTYDSDDQIMAALRAQLNLLTPEQIKEGRKKLGLKSKELAERLGVAAATLSRWEKKRLVQSRAMDNLLRVYFAVPQARAVLRGAEQDTLLGTLTTLEQNTEQPAFVHRTKVPTMTTLNLPDMLRLCGFSYSDHEARMVRHTDNKNKKGEFLCTVQDLLQGGWLDLYQSYQRERAFEGANIIVSFYATEKTYARLYGLFKVHPARPASEGPNPANCPYVATWRQDCSVFYPLERLPGYEALEHRLVIDWGPDPVRWNKPLSDRPVLELLPAGRRLLEFTDYLEFSLSNQELTELYTRAAAHRDWQAALEAVAGVYLILAEDSGRQYVGSASGASGIWGRWGDYARSGHGGNKLLRKVIAENPDIYPKNFRFSVLQVLPKTLARQEVLNREARYKEKLGTRATGLNT